MITITILESKYNISSNYIIKDFLEHININTNYLYSIRNKVCVNVNLTFKEANIYNNDILFIPE